MSDDIHKWSDGKYTLMFDEHTFFVFDNEEEKRMTALQVTKKLNEQQDIIKELKTHNLQHFLEWLVIKGYVTDEPLKDINNVIDCVDEFKEYLTELDKLMKERGI